MPVIEVTTPPRNREHFARLMAFAHEILTLCDALQIKPVLSGSLAVFAYTQDPTMEVHDVDLSCSESQFLSLCAALEDQGISCRIRDWHVLQAVRDDLKIEFDAIEYWMHDIPECYQTVRIGDLQFGAVDIDGLRELYRRGFVETAGKSGADEVKHRRIGEKLHSLHSLCSRLHE